jgi:pimeloyl-ACP methyl ester carboxylesterase
MTRITKETKKWEGDVPYASNGGIQIHYQVTGAGPPLVLQHGFMGSLDDWDELDYVAPLSAQYRLILIDARGHGGSDKPHDEASYSFERRVADVTSVLDAVQVERAHFWGYSMGGYIGFSMAKYAPHRVHGLVIGGAAPYARDMEQTRVAIRGVLAAGGGDATVAVFEAAAGPLPEGLKDRLRKADVQAFLAAAIDRPAADDALSTMTMTMPCCLYAGEADPLFEAARLASEQIPNAQVFSLPGLSHWRAFEERSVVLPRIIEFLEGADEA